MLTSKNDLAKYPFSHEARRYVETLNIKVGELDREEYSPILDRAERRVEESLLYGSVNHQWVNSDVEIISFPVSIFLVISIQDAFLNRRYSLGEARRAYNILRSERKEKILEIACGNFDWNLRSTLDNIDAQTFDFTLSFNHFLRNSIAFQDMKWKLVNRIMMGGKIYIHREEVARLLQEEVHSQLFEHLSESTQIELPKSLEQRTERLRELLERRRETIRSYEMPKEMIESAFPPCIKILYENASSGKHLSHLGRFTLTTFLLSVGLTSEKIIGIFSESSDFDEKMTAYQVEHIAGKRGSGTKYSPPNCSTLTTHGLCYNPDEICNSIRHPLSYYRQKIRVLRSIEDNEKGD